MSRSYRHSDIMPCACNKSLKKLYNRRFRRTHKNDTDFPSGNAYRKTNDSWEIVDMKIDIDWPGFRDDSIEFFDSEEECFAHWKRCYKSK